MIISTTDNHDANFGSQKGFYGVEAMQLEVGEANVAMPTNGIMASAGAVVPAPTQTDFDNGVYVGPVTTAGFTEFYVDKAADDVADGAGSTIDANTVDQSAL